MTSAGILGFSLMVIFGLNLAPAVMCVFDFSKKIPTKEELFWFGVNCATIGACLAIQLLR